MYSYLVQSKNKLHRFITISTNNTIFPLALCDKYIFHQKPQLSLPGTTQVAARIIQNLMFSMPVPPVPAPLSLNSLSGLDLCVPMSTLATGEQLQLQVCEPGSSQVSIYAANPCAHSSDPQPLSALSPHPVPLFLPPADLALFAPEPLSCLSLAGIKQLNAWADYFRDSLPPVPKDNCHWVWGLWTKPLDPTTVRILAQSIDALREPDWGGGTSSFEIQRSVGDVYKMIMSKISQLNWPSGGRLQSLFGYFPHYLPIFQPLLTILLFAHMSTYLTKRMEWFRLLYRPKWQLHSGSKMHHCKRRGMRVSGAYVFYVLLNDKKNGSGWIWEPK